MYPAEDGAVLRLAAMLVRAAAGLGDHEDVVIETGAEVVREMALRALSEHDKLKSDAGQMKHRLRIECDEKPI